MNAFETRAVLDDASHLTLREPLPRPAGSACRVLVLFESADGEAASADGWPADFFESIRVADPAFWRPAQGETPPVAALDLPA